MTTQTVRHPAPALRGRCGVSVATNRIVDFVLLAGLALCASLLRAETHAAVPRITVGAGKTRILDTLVNMQRVSLAAPEIAEAVPVSARSLMINGKGPGETSLVIWLSDGSRNEYDVQVLVAPARIEGAEEQLATEFGDTVHLRFDNGAVYLTGTVKNLYASQRAVSIAETLGRVVNLLNVDVPPQETQILLKVRFANVDRSKSQDLGVSFVGAPKGFPFATGTGAFGSGSATGGTAGSTVSISDSLNLLFWDPQINVGATLKALAGKAVLQILAEPNVLAMNGHEASFVAGGEFPFPVVSGSGTGTTQVSIQFHQFGVQIHFLPTITPRGTIRLHLTPEVSSLDYANAVTLQGSTIPALSTRRVETDIELESGQTFAVAGLLDQHTTESLSKIPGLADIPLLGKLFTSRSVTSSNSELIMIVTPEIVAPISDPRKIPDLDRPLSFMEGKGIMSEPPRTPGVESTGPPPERAKRSEIPVQEMQKFEIDQAHRTTSNGIPAVPLSAAPGSDPNGAPTAGPITTGLPVNSTRTTQPSTVARPQ